MPTFFFHQAALGDFILTFPILHALPRPLHVVAPWEKANLAARLIDGVIPHNIERKLTDLPGLPHADLIITFTGNATDLAPIAPRARIIPINPVPPGDWPTHITAWFAEQLPGEASRMIVPSVIRRGGSIVLLHPGSGGRDKCWPADRFLALAAELEQRGRRCRIIIGEAEPDIPGAHRIHSLNELADHIEAASLYIGNDAGPTHLAAAIGVPTLALFGPTDPHRWMPLGPAVTAIAPGSPSPMTWLSVDDVLQDVLHAF